MEHLNDWTDVDLPQIGVNKTLLELAKPSLMEIHPVFKNDYRSCYFHFSF